MRAYAANNARCIVVQAPYVYAAAYSRCVYTTTHCLSSTIMVAVLYPVALTLPRSTLHPAGCFSLCAMRINRHCKKNHSQSRQELVRSARCMQCIQVRSWSPKVVLDSAEVGALEGSKSARL